MLYTLTPDPFHDTRPFSRSGKDDYCLSNENNSGPQEYIALTPVVTQEHMEV